MNVLVISSLSLDMEYSIPRSFIMTFTTLSEAKEALKAQSPEVLAVALFAVPAVAAHLGEVYLAWYDHV